MHATLIVLIDREREEQKNNDLTARKDLTAGSTSHLNNTESNAFIKAYIVRCSDRDLFGRFDCVR